MLTPAFSNSERYRAAANPFHESGSSASGSDTVPTTKFSKWGRLAKEAGSTTRSAALIWYLPVDVFSESSIDSIEKTKRPAGSVTPTSGMTSDG